MDKYRQHTSIINEFLALFKGELSYNDFMYAMPYKRAMLLRDTRVKQLTDEHKRNEKADKEREAQSRRENILRK